MEAIARDAGVSKQTVYRWWPTKAAVLLEALNEAASSAAPRPDTGTVQGDLRFLLRRTVAGATKRTRRILAALMAEAQVDDSFGEAFRAGFLAERRRVLAEVLERGRATGELDSAADVDVLVELVFGTLWYRILAQNAPLDRAFADALVETVLRLAAPA
jgi:AcrR family transcriptional regulator